MPVHNDDIARAFEKIADLLELKNENPFRIRAYRAAARTVSGLSQNAVDMVVQQKDLTELPGIGKDLAKKIEEFVNTGKMHFLDELDASMPSGLSQFMDISGLGPKRIKAINEELNIKSIDELAQAAQNKKIREIRGFGEKTEQKILEGIKQIDKARQRIKLPVAEQYGVPFVEYLKNCPGIKMVEIAGSFRRRLETIGDLDILVAAKNGKEIAKKFLEYEDVQKIISKGETRSAVILRSGLQVDLRVVPEKSYGAALNYFTGSQAHNIAIRKIGVSKKLKINEYGVFRGKTSIGGKTEEEVYKKVDLPYIEPELRENRGEIEAAKTGKLPKLVTLNNIKGDLHTHTKATDGRSSLKEMADAAKKRGYLYIANTEHSKHVAVAKGFDDKKLADQIKKIDELNKNFKGFVVLKGIEVDILEDGSLDLSDDILKELDVVIGAVHYKFNLSEDKQTKRILKAMDNPHFNILAHPSGRLINERNPYDVDMERIMTAAKERGCIMELNSQPDRLDLNDIHCKMAKDIGVKIVVSTDAHNINNYEFMRYGIGQARRGWLEPEDVVNTRDLAGLKKILKR